MLRKLCLEIGQSLADEDQYLFYFGGITVIEKVLEYLNTGRGEEMTEEMNTCSYAQSLLAGKQTMELNSQYHTPGSGWNIYR